MQKLLLAGIALPLWCIAACGTTPPAPRKSAQSKAAASVAALPVAPVAPTATPVAPAAAPTVVVSAIPSPADPLAAPQALCPSDMVDVGVACIDRYEAPNRAGAMPLVMQNVPAAETWCREHGKRLCLESEWLRACRGPSGRQFPYAGKYERGRCNDDKTWRVVKWSRVRSWPSAAADAEVERLNQAEPSGQRAGCVSEEGVHDLAGNVTEWVVRTVDNPTNHSHVVKGCYWASCYRPPHQPSCDYVNYMHQAPERSYEFGFRCCADRG